MINIASLPRVSKKILARLYVRYLQEVSAFEGYYMEECPESEQLYTNTWIDVNLTTLKAISPLTDRGLIEVDFASGRLYLTIEGLEVCDLHHKALDR